MRAGKRKSIFCNSGYGDGKPISSNNFTLPVIFLRVFLLKTYEFFKYYNNNYRPIYHLENYALTMAKLVHKDKMPQEET